MCTVLEALLCISCILINSAVNLLCVQLRMFDLNGDGKLGLSEMARWVCFHLVPFVATQTSLPTAWSLSLPFLSTGSCQSMKISWWSLRSDFSTINLMHTISTTVEEWSWIKGFRQYSSVLLDSLCKDYWSSNHCLDIWALTQMYFPAYVKSIRIWIMLSDVSFQTLQRPLMCFWVPLSYWHHLKALFFRSHWFILDLRIKNILPNCKHLQRVHTV